MGVLCLNYGVKNIWMYWQLLAVAFTLDFAYGGVELVGIGVGKTVPLNNKKAKKDS